MKKIMIVCIALIGVICIGVGIFSPSFFSSKSVIVPNEVKPKRLSKNIKYQQQLIINIEKSLKDGYQVSLGNTTVSSTTFMNETSEEYIDYENCSGDVEFINQNGTINYQLKTTCKNNKENLNIDYKVADILEENISSASTYQVSDGYFIIGSVNENDNDSQYTANAILLKFNNNHQLIFSKKISDMTINNINTSSYVEIRDIFEDEDGYYIIGNVKNASGGDFEPLLTELDSIYKKNSIEQEENDFSFLFKYDKSGNLILKKLINPLDGDINIDRILGKNNHDLIITSSSRIIKYNVQSGKFKAKDLPTTLIEAQYLKNNAIYGYSIKCNYETEKTEDNKDAIIKLDLSGKKEWQKEIEIEQNIDKDKCSNLINGVYDTELGNALSYDSGKKIALYNEEGENIKNLDYSNLVTQKDKLLNLVYMEQKNEKTKVIFTNNSNIIIDTFNKKYELEKRFTVGFNDATMLLENISDVENIIPIENGFMQNKIINGNGKISIIRVNYITE